MYLTYEEYTAMGGTLDEPTFNDLEYEAEALVNWYTFNRLTKDTQIPSEVKRLIKYLINLITFFPPSHSMKAKEDFLCIISKT